MKKITNKEAKEFEYKKPGRPRGQVMQAVCDLKVGELLHIDTKEWVLSTPPQSLIHMETSHKGNSLYGRRYSIKTLAQNGWIIKRVK